jgi:excisionase family DNA binding protein
MTDILDEIQVAALLDCEPSTVQAKARDRELPAVKFGRSWRFPRAALLEVLNRKALENATPAEPIKATGVAMTPAASKRKAPPALPGLPPF